MNNRDITIYLSSIWAKKKSIEEIRKNFSEYEEIFYLEKSDLKNKLYFSDDQADRIINDEHKKIIKSIYDTLDKNEAYTIFDEDEDYPQALRYIEDAPYILYLKGKLIKEDENAVALVGARKCSAYGEHAANIIVKDLSSYKLSIVSGLADGIDSYAHRAAIDNGLRTIAVLGTGIDIVYPAKNRKLFDEISNFGAIITEFAPKTMPNKYNFPMRNRIISGMSKAVVVVEAMKRSGSLITARLAAEQGREVFAVPGNISSKSSEGTNLLIRDGATIYTGAEDFIYSIPGFENVKCKNEEGIIIPDLSETERKIYDIISEGNKDFDIILMKSGLKVFELNPILSILELKGLISEGKYRTFYKS